ncbi:M24 family metallopeptidase [Sphingobium sp. Sx8-8]|uniref:M24 family metallopeptidase n=1 Tax=Sphingobium sp. Sx8-8 TaxID=2933617 RepID=UPI001F58399B|nr:M24 family metallopeptidase [Sphingobium sp. Sx8-8]
MINLDGDLGIPKFSLAEREHRWARVRRLMERDGMDAIFVPPHTGLFDTQQANTRYLTGLGGNHWTLATIFPIEGDVTVFTSADVHPTICMQRQDWVDDVRVMTGAWGFTRSAIERLKELRGLRRLGVFGLAGNTRFPEGTTSHGTVQLLREALRDVELVNATSLMAEARFIKSREEIAFLRKGTEILERAIDVIVQEARPGVPENVIYAHMVASLVESGSELPAFILWSAGSPQPLSNAYMPSRRALRAGDAIMTELQARYAGCDAAGAQALFLGRAPDDYHEMFARQQEAVRICHAMLRPGQPVGAIAESINGMTDARFDVRVLMHGRGMGDDSPLAVFGVRDAAMANWTVEENSAFVVKPIVSTKDRSKWIYWGDTVICTPQGAERLGKRAPAIIEIL